ncbi:MAG TPA: winged helix-turn-helix transcriptional regulator, partial [Candidatus Fermentibacter daniensis]|nr:winged helix-turn-helix transcriptional regulator [Candidatus Fermentibacter daniensis]
WGRGTLKIARLMREQGLEPPEVAVREGAVAVTFRIATTLTRETTGITTGKMTGKMIGKMIGKTPGAVLELLRTDPGLTVIELAVRLGKSEITIHRAVRVLREAGLLQRIGPDKGGYWKVLD